MSFTNRKIKIKAKTWKRDSYGLYDYETTNYHLQTFEISKIGRVIRSNNEIACHPYTAEETNTKTQDSKNMSQQDMQVLSTISQDAEGIKFATNLAESDEESQVWMAVGKKSGTAGYVLQENDTLKLGRVKVRVKQISLGAGQNLHQSSNDLILDSIREYMTIRDGRQSNENANLNTDNDVTQEDLRGVTCKICLGEKVEEDDPLISPCKCIGSVKYVHLKCLQNWVKSKLNIEQAQKIISIYWKNLSCELCKADLPLYLNHQGHEVLLLPFQRKTTGPYVILESFSKEKDPFGIHVIDLSSNQTFRIGRSHDCDLKFNDISVSRIHTILKVAHGKLYLKDNYSKFGTLVLLREPIILNDDSCKSPWLQCGRTIFRFSLKKPWAVAFPCLGTIFGLGRFCETKNNTDSERRKTEVPREHLFTNYEDV